LEKYTYIDDAEISLRNYLSRIIRYYYLFKMLVIRDLRIRYSQTFLGLLWSVLQPVAGVAIFSFFFSYLVKMDTGSLPYPLVALSGLACWNYFSFTLNSGGTALIQSQMLIRKVSFPKIILVLTKSVVGLIDMVVCLVLLLLGVIIWGEGLSIKWLLVPLIVGMNFLCGFSFALWCSALTIRYRDLQHLIPFILTFSIWLTPVLYPSTVVPDRFLWLVFINPVAGLIEWFRYIVLDMPLPDPRYFAGLVVLLLVSSTGIIYFKKLEKIIPDYF